MITGDLKNKVDRVWDTFCTGGISNPLEVIEQITYLLFLKRLDERHQLAENRAAGRASPSPATRFRPGMTSRVGRRWTCSGEVMTALIPRSSTLW